PLKGGITMQRYALVSAHNLPVYAAVTSTWVLISVGLAASLRWLTHASLAGSTTRIVGGSAGERG
ncbi:MAG: hypothetical protein KFH98_14400, partial [Gemmatimonadetes bacterium]|nr:hypothetical protein [Gemmatimonadota bacterium]